VGLSRPLCSLRSCVGSCEGLWGDSLRGARTIGNSYGWAKSKVVEASTGLDVRTVANGLRVSEYRAHLPIVAEVSLSP
jgi:hypothetical protein